MACSSYTVNMVRFRHVLASGVFVRGGGIVGASTMGQCLQTETFSQCTRQVIISMHRLGREFLDPHPHLGLKNRRIIYPRSKVMLSWSCK